MAKTYLEIQITKELETSLYVALAENDPRLKALVRPDGKINHYALHNPEIQELIKEGIAKTIKDFDWAETGSFDAWAASVVTEEEAEKFLVHKP